MFDPEISIFPIVPPAPPATPASEGQTPANLSEAPSEIPSEVGTRAASPSFRGDPRAPLPFLQELLDRVRRQN